MRFYPFLHAVAGLLFISLLSGCVGGHSSPSPSPTPSPTPTPTPTTVALTTVVSGLVSPVDLQTPDDNSGRLFVVEQTGTIRIISNGALLSGNFLDITSKVDFGGEKGLLGVAFHPNYSQSGRFYLNYDRISSGEMETVIAEYKVLATDPNQADPASERILLTVNQPFPNHKGGQLAFGPDGFLYIGLGDGGSEGDPLGKGQNLQTLLGKILRIDVDGAFAPGKQYAIPADNPFTPPGGLPEIWAYGLRNPWRFSFDRVTGKLFAGDVGQHSFEEVDIITRAGNFGWNKMEASQAIRREACAARQG